MANAYTRAMAEFVAGLQYRAIPSEVRERIKLLILDARGWSGAGFSTTLFPGWTAVSHA
jgi:2-methylcitrate dehydratase PrpD